jgi:hypothetical protein
METTRRVLGAIVLALLYLAELEFLPIGLTRLGLFPEARDPAVLSLGLVAWQSALTLLASVSLAGVALFARLGLGPRAAALVAVPALVPHLLVLPVLWARPSGFTAVYVFTNVGLVALMPPFMFAALGLKAPAAR